MKLAVSTQTSTELLGTGQISPATLDTLKYVLPWTKTSQNPIDFCEPDPRYAVLSFIW